MTKKKSNPKAPTPSKKAPAPSKPKVRAADAEAKSTKVTKSKPANVEMTHVPENANASVAVHADHVALVPADSPGATGYVEMTLEEARAEEVILEAQERIEQAEKAALTKAQLRDQKKQERADAKLAKFKEKNDKRLAKFQAKEADRAAKRAEKAAERETKAAEKTAERRQEREQLNLQRAQQRADAKAQKKADKVAQRAADKLTKAAQREADKEAAKLEQGRQRELRVAESAERKQKLLERKQKNQIPGERRPRATHVVLNAEGLSSPQQLSTRGSVLDYMKANYPVGEEIAISKVAEDVKHLLFGLSVRSVLNKLEETGHVDFVIHELAVENKTASNDHVNGV